MDAARRAPKPPVWFLAIVAAEAALLIGTTVAFGLLMGLAVFLIALLPVVLIGLPLGIVQGYRRYSRHD